MSLHEDKFVTLRSRPRRFWKESIRYSLGISGEVKVETLKKKKKNPSSSNVFTFQFLVGAQSAHDFYGPKMSTQNCGSPPSGPDSFFFL
jgi:hypothetical protein